MKHEALGFEIVMDEDGFQIWTPDEFGAVIGTGKTREAAIQDAIESLQLTIPKLRKEL